MFKRYVNDSHARFLNKVQSLNFLDIFNFQHIAIQYTIDFENENKQLHFLDITIKSNENNSLNFKVFFETTITNVPIKLHSRISPNIAIYVFE